ncbi:MAG: DUF6150 family protein [Bacteroidota bacterium]
MNPFLTIAMFLLIPLHLHGQKVYKVKYESQADKKVYFVKYESQADLKICFVKHESQAGWKNQEKQHLLL